MFVPNYANMKSIYFVGILLISIFSACNRPDKVIRFTEKGAQFFQDGSMPEGPFTLQYKLSSVLADSLRESGFNSGQIEHASLKSFSLICSDAEKMGGIDSLKIQITSPVAGLKNMHTIGNLPENGEKITSNIITAREFSEQFKRDPIYLMLEGNLSKPRSNGLHLMMDLDFEIELKK